MKQYSSYGCNIFACNILVKDGYDGILRQYEVLCTTEAITCQCCNNFKTVQSKTGRDQTNYHSHYNSFTAWPQHVISSHLTFHAVMQKIHSVNQSQVSSLWRAKAMNINIKHPKWAQKWQPIPVEAQLGSNPWILQVSYLRSIRKQFICCQQSTGSWLTTSCV